MEQIKAGLDKKGIELLSAKKDLEVARDSIKALHDKKRDFELSVDGDVSRAREAKKSEVLKASSASLEIELAAAENELAELRREKSIQIDHYSFENIKKLTVSKSPVGQETQLLLQELQQEAYDTVSPRFVDAYFDSLGKCRVSEEDFLNALDHLEEARDSFYSQRDNRINMMLESLIAKVTSLNLGEDEEKEGISGTAIGIGVVAAALSVIVFPIYSILCAITYIFNLKKAFLMKKSLNLLKVIGSNFKLMEKAIEARSYMEYTNKQQEIEDEFSDAINIVQKEIDNINQQISTVRQQAIADFTFDEKPVREQLRETIEGIQHSIIEQERSEKVIEEKIRKINQEIVKLRAQYEAAIKSIIDDYINFERVGDSKLFPESFLLTDSEPLKFFDKGRCSNFFVYNETPLVMDFIKLLCLQVRTRMAPNTVYTQVWDISSSGSQLMALSNPDSTNPSSLFTIVNTSSEIKEEIESFSAILRKRLQDILSKGQDINKYNEDMIMLKSVTEPYYFIIVLSPEAVLSDESFRRLLINGPAVGIYVYIFADVVKLSEQYFQMIESVEYCENVYNGKVLPSAQGALIDRIKNIKKNK